MVIGWNDRRARPVGETRGNVYGEPRGPTTAGTLTQAIYYAENIAPRRREHGDGDLHATSSTDVSSRSISGIDRNPLDAHRGVGNVDYGDSGA